MKKCVCTIFPYDLVDLKYSQLFLRGSNSALESCRFLLSQRNHFFCHPHRQQKKLGILYHSGQQFGDQNIFQDLTNLGLISSSTGKIFTRMATLEDVRQCLEFTLTARLAPRWNPVGKWFIHRQQDNFLDMDDSSDFQATEFDVRLSESNDRIEVWVYGGELRLFSITPHHLVVNSDELSHFMEDPVSVINFRPNAHHRFFYLPKVRAGTLVSISRYLPTSSPFKSYGDLSAYWREQYGYELPEDSNGIVYFNVAFSNEGTVYTYPSCCVFREEPQILPTSAKSSHSIVLKFWLDLEKLLQFFPGLLTPESWLLNPHQRVPWHQKFSADLENDVKMKSLTGCGNMSDNGNKISKYFQRTESDKEIPKKGQEKNLNTSGSRRTVNSKITNYFSAQHPNIKIRRTATKVTFKPVLNPKKCTSTEPEFDME